MRKIFFISLYYITYIFLKDFTFALLIHFYDNWMSSFIILPSITLLFLLLIRMWREGVNSVNHIREKIDFNFLLRIFFICLCLFIYAELLYGLIDHNFLSKPPGNISFSECAAMILAAVGEEFFFRGYLLHHLLKDIGVKNKSSKMLFFSILTTILFCLAHKRYDVFVVQYFIFSMICSLIYIKSNLLYTILFHSFYNIMVLLSIGKVLQLEKLRASAITIGLFLSVTLIIFQLFKLKRIKISNR